MFYNGYFIRWFYKYLFYISVIYYVCIIIIMWLLVYGMLVNVNGIYYEHVREQACWARLAGKSAIEFLLLFIIIISLYLSLSIFLPLSIPLFPTLMRSMTKGV